MSVVSSECQLKIDPPYVERGGEPRAASVTTETQRARGAECSLAHPLLDPVKDQARGVRSQVVFCQPESNPLSPQTGQCQSMAESFSASIKAIICPGQGLCRGRLRHLIPVSGAPVRAGPVTASTMEPK